MSGQQGGESMSGTTIRDFTDPPIIDQYGNQWSISRSAQVKIDGEIDRTTSGVTELAYINRLIWQWVASKRLWWSKSSPIAPWIPIAGTTDAPFGPTPDPRLDQILVAVASLAQADAAAFGNSAALIATVQATVEALPPPSPPDPRLAALIGTVIRGFQAERGLLTDMTAAAETERALLAAWWDTLLTRLDTMDAANAATAASLDALTGQVNRIVVMLLDLFPGQKPKIVIDTGNVTFTTQPAPTSPGP